MKWSSLLKGTHIAQPKNWIHDLSIVILSAKPLCYEHSRTLLCILFILLQRGWLNVHDLSGSLQDRCSQRPPWTHLNNWTIDMLLFSHFTFVSTFTAVASSQSWLVLCYLHTSTSGSLIYLHLVTHIVSTTSNCPTNHFVQLSSISPRMSPIPLQEIFACYSILIYAINMKGL